MKSVELILRKFSFQIPGAAMVVHLLVENFRALFNNDRLSTFFSMGLPDSLTLVFVFISPNCGLIPKYTLLVPS